MLRACLRGGIHVRYDETSGKGIPFRTVLPYAVQVKATFLTLADIQRPFLKSHGLIKYLFRIAQVPKKSKRFLRIRPNPALASRLHTGIRNPPPSAVSFVRISAISRISICFCT